MSRRCPALTHAGGPGREGEVVEVLYIDHNHFHMVGNVSGGATAPF